MERITLAPGAHINVLPAEKFTSYIRSHIFSKQYAV